MKLAVVLGEGKVGTANIEREFARELTMKTETLKSLTVRALLMIGAAAALNAQPYVIDWRTIDGGGRRKSRQVERGSWKNECHGWTRNKGAEIRL